MRIAAEDLIFIASLLEAVASGELSAQTALARWPVPDGLRDELVADSWGALSHFANDGDIRERDSSYASHQHDQLRSYAKALRMRTVFAQDEDVVVEVSPSSSYLVLAAELVATVASAAILAMFLAPHLIPNVNQVIRWPRFAMGLIALWFVVRILLPEAWHHRRDDKGGLAFVLGFLGIVLFALWTLLYPDAF